jgi:dethiobiotin synthetase
MSAARGILVTGTDTGVGKTRVAVALLQALADRGIAAAGMKPVAAGIAPGATANEDVLQLMAAAGVDAPLADVNPFAYPDPIAPHVAAAAAGHPIALEAIGAAYGRLARRADAVVVEGAGGALVPLDARHDVLDIAATLRLPVLLVVGVRLGCINHALLTALAIRSRGLDLAGWVANRIDPAMDQPDASITALAERLAAPCVADLGWNVPAVIGPSGLAALGWPVAPGTQA